ncbi:dicarboxylic acid transporter [Laetiporus sulphureus 93-53]|uniref:Dicarboxylic acid transporter n=1 Tax=Laetiporus sulphureus 93-53 TaxID=1314785 RepID=A0A165E4A8_9APHY|nr:dicarboxylic acid transporter [Laetiporus sulphureus 93-53]KZT06219.1 dicarboxylic acid transporter [Laetiporus sulphureus 93-53]
MPKKQTYPFCVAGVAGSMAACCTHPLDLTKVRMQTIPPLPGAKRPSTLSVIRTTVAEQGVKSLYTGLTASLLRQMSYSLVRLGSYESMKEHLSKDGRPSGGTLLLAAMLAGGLGGVAGNPADILLVRMTSDSIRPLEHRYHYSNALSGLVTLVRHEGARGLARGLGTNTTRAVLMNGSQVWSYDLFKTILLRHRIPVIDYHFHDNLGLHMAASTLAGTVATTVCSPADVMRSRLMSAKGKSRPLEVLTRSLREEGPRFLFKGWTPAFIRLGPNTIFMFVFLEQLKKGWRTLFPAQ